MSGLPEALMAMLREELAKSGGSFRQQSAESKAELAIVRERLEVLCAGQPAPSSTAVLAALSVTADEVAARVAESGDQS